MSLATTFTPTPDDQAVSAGFAQIQQVLAGAEKDMTDATTKGNAAAGTRLRKAMQQIRVLAEQVRKDEQKAKNSRHAAQ